MRQHSAGRGQARNGGSLVFWFVFSQSYCAVCPYSGRRPVPLFWRCYCYHLFQWINVIPNLFWGIVSVYSTLLGPCEQTWMYYEYYKSDMFSVWTWSRKSWQAFVPHLYLGWVECRFQWICLNNMFTPHEILPSSVMIPVDIIPIPNAVRTDSRHHISMAQHQFQ